MRPIRKLEPAHSGGRRTRPEVPIFALLQRAARLVEVVGAPGRRAALSAGAILMAARFDWDRTATEVFRVLASTAGGR